MHVVIFGATGKVGQELVNYIHDVDPTVKMTAIGYRIDNVFQSIEGVQYFSGDIADLDFFDILPKQCDAIINLAGSVTTRVNSSEIEKYISSNIIGANNVLRYAVNTQADRILYAQTYNDVFGDKDNEILIKPDAVRKRFFTGESAIYTITKNCAVDLQNYYCSVFGLKSFVFRLPTVHCYTKDPNYMVGGVVKVRPFRKMIIQAIHSDTIEIWGDPGRVMDMVYVEDCCQMFYKALIVNNDGGFYNVGTGVGTTIEEQVQGVINVFSPVGIPSAVVYCPEKKSGPSYIMDITNAKTELGYAPKFTYLDMLKIFKSKMIEDGTIMS